MPCNCDHLEATYDETESKKICEHICFLFPNIGKHVPDWVTRGAHEYYGISEKLAELEFMLHEAIFFLSKEEKEKYLYDGRSKESRLLANWHEDYIKNNKDENERVKRKRELEKRAKSILSKLRKEEVEIITNYIKKFQQFLTFLIFIILVKE